MRTRDIAAPSFRSQSATSMPPTAPEVAHHIARSKRRAMPDRGRGGRTAVFLVDDHELLRRGVAALLALAPDLVVVGEAGTVAQAAARIPAVRPDVAVLDVRLPDGDGVELCRDLRSRLPALKCLMLTAFADEQALADAVLAGASGYLVKDIVGARLVQSIRDVAAGRSLLDTRATAILSEQVRERRIGPRELEALSARERRILDHIGDGLSNREIAERMYLAEKTVKNYVSRLLKKLGIERRTQAAVLATKLRQQPPSHRR